LINNEEDMKSGFISIIGRPNTGKSTLLNTIIGTKVAIATSKPQTTRNTIRGIFTDHKRDKQMVFLDTPGIHMPKNKLGEKLVASSRRSMRDVDLVLLLVDERSKLEEEDKIFKNLASISSPKIIVINKLDLMNPDQYKELYDYYKTKEGFNDVIGITAKDGKNVDTLLDEVASYCNDENIHFPENMYTDQQERFLASEIIREKLFMYLDKEVPFGVAVSIEKFKEIKGIIDMEAVITCERDSHKSIIIGKSGRKLKGVGKSARLELEDIFGVKVNVKLWVRVRKNWRESDVQLKNLGYGDI